MFTHDQMKFHLNSGNYYKIVKYNENCGNFPTHTLTHYLKYSVQISNLKDFLCTLAALQSKYLFKVLLSLSLPTLNISRPQSASQSLRGRQV